MLLMKPPDQVPLTFYPHEESIIYNKIAPLTQYSSKIKLEISSWYVLTPKKELGLQSMHAY